MKKLGFVVSLLTIFLFSPQVSAHEGRLAGDNCHKDNINGGRHCYDENGNIVPKVQTYKATRIEAKTDIKAQKKEFRGEVKANRIQAKKNRKDFRSENAAQLKEIKSTLSQEEKKELKGVKNIFMSQAKDLKKSLKNANSEEERDSIRQKIQELREAQFTSISDILGEDTQSILEKRKAVYMENEALRKENRDVRAEYKAERKVYINTYKEAFIKRIGTRLDKIPTANLEKAAEKIDALLKKTENNTGIKEDKKQAKLDAILALREIVEDRIENDEADEDVLETLEDLLDE